MAEIKKPNTFFPKVFKTFTIYIFSTLLVFFVYIQIFGNVSPTILQLPTGSVGAEETSVFGSFVNSFGNFENIDADFELTFSNSTSPNVAEEDKVTLSISGNVVYDGSGLSLDLELSLNEQDYSFQVAYVGSYVFLTLENQEDENSGATTTYMFDASTISTNGDISFSDILDFATSTLGLDLSFLDDVASSFGIDLNNFDVSSLMSILDTSKSKELDDGGYEVVINIKNVIELDIICDENYNIISATSNHIKVNYNELYLNLNVNKMNNVLVSTGEETDVSVNYEITGDEVDLTGLALNAEYTSNLFDNEHIVGTFSLKSGNDNLEGKIYIDTQDTLQIAVVTDLAGAKVQIVYVDQVVYLDVDGARLSFDIDNLNVLKNQIELVFEQYGDEIYDVFIEVLESLIGDQLGCGNEDCTCEKCEFDLDVEISNFVENFDMLTFLKKVFAEKFSLTEYLPISSVLTENSYVLSWKNGFSIELFSENVSIDEDMVLKKVRVVYGDFEFEIEFDVAESGYDFGMENEDFYDLLSNQSGVLTFTYTDENGNSVKFDFDIELGLTEEFYAHMYGTVLNEEIEILILENVLYVKLGDVCTCVDLTDFDKIVNLVEIFTENELIFLDLGITEQILQVLEFLMSFTANENVELSFDGIKNFAYTISEERDKISIVLDIDSNLSVKIVLQEYAEFEKASAPTVTDEIDSVLTKVKNLIEFFESETFGFNFSLNYNGLALDGTFIYEKDDQGNLIEISLKNVFGEKAVIRIVDNMIYLEYGNYMKFKFDMPESTGNSDFFSILEDILYDQLGVTVQLGEFENLAEILLTYSLSDYAQNMSLSISGSLQNLSLTLSQLGKSTGIAIMNILTADIIFDVDVLSGVNFKFFDSVITGNLTIDYNANGISDFNPDDFSYYQTNYVEALLGSLETDEGVIAFSSDIAIRYSNNNFYGELTALLIPTEDESGDLTYTPAISLYTTSLGLSTYVYLIDNTVYIDLNGLQIYADLSENTIEEIIDFIYENFGEYLESEDGEIVDDILGSLETTTSAFKVILPAIDQIYGKWVTLLTENGTYNGIQINIGKTVSRENIVKTQTVYNDETGVWETVQTYSSDIADYGGQGNVLQYGENSWFYNIVMQLYIQNIDENNQQILPTKIILGANIYDPNTVLYADYSEYLLDCEESVTSDLNFAIYLTNIFVGNDVKSLDGIFISDSSSSQNICAVKSNYDQTNLEEFNSYTTLLEIVETAKNYALETTYQFSIDGTISAQDSTTEIGGKVRVKVEEVEGEANASGIDLFDGMALTVQATNLDVVQKTNGTATAEHLINLIYESDGDGLFVTYTHDNLADDSSGVTANNNIGSNYFRAKIGNSNLSEIISMLVALLNIDLGDSLTQALSLDKNPNTTDFSFLQKLLGISTTSESVDISKADQILSSVESMTKMLKNIKLDKVLTDESQGLYQTTLTITLDFNADDEESAGQNYATLKLVFEQEIESSNVVQKLSQISIQDVVIGESTMNFVIEIEEFDNNFDYFTNNPKDDHIDFSELSSFMDTATNTLNQVESASESDKASLETATHSFNYKGTASIDINLSELDSVLFGWLLKLIGSVGRINVGIDLYGSIDVNGELYLYIQLEITSTGIGSWIFSDSPDTIYTILEYNANGDGLLTIRRYSVSEELDTSSWLVWEWFYWTKVARATLSNNSYSISYSLSDLGNLDTLYNFIQDIMGLNSTGISIIEAAIENIEAHPTLEQALLGFEKTSSGYDLLVSGSNLMGISNVNDMTISLGTSSLDAYDSDGQFVKTYSYIQSIATNIEIANIVFIDLNLDSVDGTSYTTASANVRESYNDSATSGELVGGLTIYTNDYCRKQYLKALGLTTS